MARRLLTDEVFPVRETELEELALAADPEVVYYLRAMTTEVVRDLQRQHTRLVQNARTHQKDKVVDEIALNNALIDRTIVRWDGIYDGETPALCDLEHKLKLPIALQTALIERAQVGEVAGKAASFRSPA